MFVGCAPKMTLKFAVAPSRYNELQAKHEETNRTYVYAEFRASSRTAEG